MGSVSCTVCGETCEWTEAPYYESHSWELESRHYRNYRTIRLPNKYHLVNIYDKVVCEECEGTKGWRKRLMDKINTEALKKRLEQIGYAKSNLKQAEQERDKRAARLKELEDWN